MHLVFMGTPDFAVPSLKSLLNSGHRVLGVITQPDRPRGRGQKLKAPPVKLVAQQAGLPIRQPLSKEELLVALQHWQPQIIVVVAFGWLLPRAVLELPAAGCLNVPASLLPRYRGAAPIHRAVMNGETETGVTTMWISERMDAGDIILQERVPIGFTDTTGEVHDRLALAGA
ncbi:MAG: methionyl-tRNA formyltransferase, partial [Clostridia bacterium]|nr:methionyl-tRNA formyltransferase [Clostridia bacterium]